MEFYLTLLGLAFSDTNSRNSYIEISSSGISVWLKENSYWRRVGFSVCYDIRIRKNNILFLNKWIWFERRMFVLVSPDVFMFKKKTYFILFSIFINAWLVNFYHKGFFLLFFILFSLFSYIPNRWLKITKMVWFFLYSVLYYSLLFKSSSL